MKTLILSLCLSLIASICLAQGSTGSKAVQSYGSTGSYAESAYGSTGTAVAVKAQAASGGSTGTVARRTPIRTIRENAKARRESRRSASVSVQVQAVQAEVQAVDCVNCGEAPAAPVSVAQAKAEAMASRGRLSHAGPLAGSREGVGFSTRSAQDAIASCCFAGRLQAKDVGVARGRDGWYACQGY